MPMVGRADGGAVVSAGLSVVALAGVDLIPNIGGRMGRAADSQSL